MVILDPVLNSMTKCSAPACNAINSFEMNPINLLSLIESNFLFWWIVFFTVEFFGNLNFKLPLGFLNKENMGKTCCKVLRHVETVR